MIICKWYFTLIILNIKSSWQSSVVVKNYSNLRKWQTMIVFHIPQQSVPPSDPSPWHSLPSPVELKIDFHNAFLFIGFEGSIKQWLFVLLLNLVLKLVLHFFALYYTLKLLKILIKNIYNNSSHVVGVSKNTNLYEWLVLKKHGVRVFGITSNSKIPVLTYKMY